MFVKILKKFTLKDVVFIFGHKLETDKADHSREYITIFSAKECFNMKGFLFLLQIDFIQLNVLLLEIRLLIILFQKMMTFYDSSVKHANLTIFDLCY